MKTSSQDRINAIEAWFQSHDDGDFARMPEEHLSTRSGDFNTAKSILYMTKPGCLPRIKLLLHVLQPLAVIGRYGLPDMRDMPLIQDSSSTIIFIGDADPPDILVYAWLREHAKIAWMGVSDSFLDQHGNHAPPAIRLPLSDTEREVLKHLDKLCPDYRMLVGEFCASLLDAGVKIELEGAIANLQSKSS